MPLNRLIVVSVATIDFDARAAGEDGDLIERSLAGNETAFAEIVARHQKKIYAVALAIVRDEAEADTITQDTFVQAYLHLSRFERRSQFETWLTRIAINRARDALRWRRRHDVSIGVDVHEKAGIDMQPDAERQAMSKEIEAALERSLASLSAQQKTIFRLRHYEDLRLEEIAKLLGLRAGTVRAHLFRAVRKLRNDLGPWFEDRRKQGPTP